MALKMMITKISSMKSKMQETNRSQTHDQEATAEELTKQRLFSFQFSRPLRRTMTIRRLHFKSMKERMNFYILGKITNEQVRVDFIT